MPILSPNPGVRDNRETIGRHEAVNRETIGSKRDNEIKWIVMVLIELSENQNHNYLICSCWSCKVIRFKECGIGFSHWTRLESWI